MTELQRKSCRTLELPKVLELLARQAVSPKAKEMALALEPEQDVIACSGRRKTPLSWPGFLAARLFLACGTFRLRWTEPPPAAV